MFIKKTTKTDTQTGKKYCAYHLVESARTEKGPRQRTLLYMGSEIDLPEGEHKLLAQRIEEIIKGEHSFLPCTDHIEQLAQRFASQLINRLSTFNDNPASCQESAEEPKFINIDINSIETSHPRSVGAEDLMLKMAKQLELPNQLKKLGLSETDTAIALGSIIARTIFPDSERSTYAWLCNDSGLGELINFDFNKVSIGKLYKVSDKLLKHKEALENYLEATESMFHAYHSTIALYDLTNTYMEGQNKSNPKAKYGMSKEKRNDCPLVTMGLVINEHGFIHRTSILPGNASEPKTLEQMIKSLSAHQTLSKPTLILDGGIATQDNLDWLRRNGYTYVVSARQNPPSIELERELEEVGDLHNFVKVALIKSEDEAEEKWLYCESEAKKAVALSMKQSFSSRYEEELKKVAESLTKPQGRKKFIKVVERISRLKEKHKRISGCYEVKTIPSEDGQAATAIEWEVIDEKMSDKLTGKYFLRTNLLNKGAKELWQLYNTLRGVEDAFRFMKSSIGLRPVYHQKEHRVDGHLWITILGYHLIQQCLYQLSQQGINYQWKTVRKIMKGRIRVTMQAKTKDGKTLHYRSTTKAESDQKEIYKALGVTSPILRTKKILV